MLELEKAVRKPVHETSDDFMDSGEPNRTPLTSANGVGNITMKQPLPHDRVPSHLFSTTIAQQGVPATIAGQPIALKTAMK